MPTRQHLLKLLRRWLGEAGQGGHTIKRIAVGYKADRDGFWLARWLRAHGSEVYVIHPASVAVSREHRRAETDRLDTESLMRAFLGWLRGEKRRHCTMAPIPTLEKEDARRPNREPETLIGEKTRLINRIKAILIRFGIRAFKRALRQAADKLDSIRTAEGTPLPDNMRAELRRFLERLRLVREQIRAIERERERRLAAAAAIARGPHAMVRLIARIIGIGFGTADMLVNEILSRDLRDRRAVARYAGLTASPDESGSRRREKGLPKRATRARRGMLQLAWRFLLFQKDSALAQWFPGAHGRRPQDHAQEMVVALARKLLIALWRLVTAGEVPKGVVLRPV
ncbi:IS110 family transposase [Mesorhizobium sp.]|uniref:IS110 family transposase n=1 Tax=Mesorhizobium sp. TaxID=1871066 RepID=UPI002584C8D7|nr:IS110 family transposase [Mesorhizobium sp.]